MNTRRKPARSEKGVVDHDRIPPPGVKVPIVEYSDPYNN